MSGCITKEFFFPQSFNRVGGSTVALTLLLKKTMNILLG